MKMIKVTIDAGHGEGKAHNRGALIGNEGDNNFHYSLVLKKALEEYPIDVNLTRPKIGDDPTLEQRGAMAKGSDLLLSVHSNAFEDPTANGIVILDSVRRPNKVLATALVNGLAKLFRYNRGVKYKKWGNTDWYGILRASEAKSAMLVEHGFHTNKVDVKVYIDQREELAKITADIVAEHYGLNKKDVIPVEPPKPNTKKFKVGDKVQVNGVLHRDSYGNGPSRQYKGTNTVQYVAMKNTHPYHINGLGWVRAQDVSEVPKAPAKPAKPTPTKSIEEMAAEVKLGLHGNGHANRQKSLGLNATDYAKVRALVNKGTTKTIDQMVKEVLAGKHGNGHARRQRSLGISNAMYAKVRAEVNKKA